jgi:hypothetical protein
VIALRVVDAVRFEPTGGGIVRHELGDGLFPRAPGDAGDRPDHELVHPAGEEVADEVAVDLEVVEGQGLEVVEGAETRAFDGFLDERRDPAPAL